MNVHAHLPIWQRERAELLIYAQDSRNVAHAIADKWRAGRVCCEGRCSCDMDAAGSASDRERHARMHNDANACMAQAFRLSQKIRAAERILSARTIPSPRLTPQITLKEAA